MEVQRVTGGPCRQDLPMRLQPISSAALNAETLGEVVVNKTVETNSKGKANLDLDLKKGEYNVTVDYGGNQKYNGNNTIQKLTIKEESSSENNVDMSLYSSYSPTVCYYRIVERQQELGVIETSSGNYYVIAGDGIYTYEGHDSQGNIQFGSPV